MKPRISVSINSPQDTFLKRVSAAREVSVADVVRWIIDDYRLRVGDIDIRGEAK